MQMRYPPQPDQAKTFTTAELRENFLIEKLFTPGDILMVYSHIDRIITGGAAPIKEPLALVGDPKTLGAAFFLERREMGVVNVGGPGKVTVDGNHPFAGKTLTYALTIADVRDATEDEKRNGVARPVIH